MSGCSRLSSNIKSNAELTFSNLQLDIQRQQEDLRSCDERSGEIKVEFHEAVKAYNKANATYQNAYDSYQKDLKECDAKVKESEAEISSLNDKITSIDEKIKNSNFSLAELQKAVAGVIKCPKCSHEFTLSGDLDIDKARNDISRLTQEIDDMWDEINKKRYEVNEKRSEINKNRSSLSESDSRQRELDTVQNEAKRKKQSLEHELDNINAKIDSLNRSISNSKKEIISYVDKIFDDTYDELDKLGEAIENENKKLENDINLTNAAIKQYEEYIESAQNASQDGFLETLRERHKVYSSELNDLKKEEEDKRLILDNLKKQIQTFVEFKTYLANTKIEAISEITNAFLETIGSDIRVEFSGYTMLKSGKLRDKISVSLMRDGIDCGSFDKFSKGEQTRVELACMLAIRELTNNNAPDGKGLNLLVIDELLDCCDENGLANVFQALNKTLITSIIVSHGNIMEGYPHKIVVAKQNGVSHIENDSKI